MTLYAPTDDLSIVRIGGAVVPGIVQSIEVPERAIRWDIQEGVSGIGGFTNWRGVKIIESIKITTMLATKGAPMSQWDEATAAWIAFLKMIDPAPLKRKPPAWDADHPLFRMLWPPLGRVAHKSNRPAPAHERGLAWLGVLELLEYRPLKLVAAGPPEPAQIDSRDQPPADAHEANLQALSDKAAQVRREGEALLQ